MMGMTEDVCFVNSKEIIYLYFKKKKKNNYRDSIILNDRNFDFVGRKVETVEIDIRRWSLCDPLNNGTSMHKWVLKSIVFPISPRPYPTSASARSG